MHSKQTVEIENKRKKSEVPRHAKSISTERQRIIGVGGEAEGRTSGNRRDERRKSTRWRDEMEWIGTGGWRSGLQCQPLNVTNRDEAV